MTKYREKPRRPAIRAARLGWAPAPFGGAPRSATCSSATAWEMLGCIARSSRSNPVSHCKEDELRSRRPTSGERSQSGPGTPYFCRRGPLDAGASAERGRERLPPVRALVPGAGRARRRAWRAAISADGDVLRVVAGGQVAVGVLGQLRLDRAAHVGGPRAAGVEAAARRRADRVRRLAGDDRRARARGSPWGRGSGSRRAAPRCRGGSACRRAPRPARPPSACRGTSR